MKKLQLWMAALGAVSGAGLTILNYKTGNTDLALAWFSSTCWAMTAFTNELNNHKKD